jgi:hypothetical protein
MFPGLRQSTSVVQLSIHLQFMEQTLVTSLLKGFKYARFTELGTNMQLMV